MKSRLSEAKGLSLVFYDLEAACWRHINFIFLILITFHSIIHEIRVAILKTEDKIALNTVIQLFSEEERIQSLLGKDGKFIVVICMFSTTGSM